MHVTANLTNHFLIAMPALADPNFFHTVTYICEHNANGAMGLVVNRPLDLQFHELLAHLDLETHDPELAQLVIYQGGPVQTERGFVLHSNDGEWDASIQVTDALVVTMSQDIIEAIALGEGPRQYLITLGYAGWGEGQLEEELASNAWLNGPAEASIMFDLPVAQRWSAAAAHLGVELSRLSTDVGHA
ncbi:MAG: YqgE/AlgH family protein [Gammaproteobacteria bacterium]